MTSGEFREVDPDLLADYLGGVLDGTPEETRVARLVAEDPAWRQAHAELSSAIGIVQAQLAELAVNDDTMPADIAARLDAALDATVAADTATTADTAAESTAGSAPSSARRLRAVPDPVPTRPTPAAPPGRAGRSRVTRRRRWSRLAAPIGVAAAVLAAVGLGVGWLPGTSDNAETAASDTTAQQNTVHRPRSTATGGPTSPGPLLGQADQHLLASGRDYTPNTLNRVTGYLSPSPARPSIRSGPAMAPSADSGDEHSVEMPAGTPPTAAGLSRLSEQSALRACLDAVTTAHGQGPLTVDLIDYASFEGSPALVLVFTDPTGARWIWVTGPSCGLASAGADMRHRTQVG